MKFIKEILVTVRREIQNIDDVINKMAEAEWVTQRFPVSFYFTVRNRRGCGLIVMRRWLESF